VFRFGSCFRSNGPIAVEEPHRSDNAPEEPDVVGPLSYGILLWVAGVTWLTTGEPDLVLALPVCLATCVIHNSRLQPKLPCGLIDKKLCD